MFEWIVAVCFGALIWLHTINDKKVIKVSQKLAKVEKEVEQLQYDIDLLQRKADKSSK